MRSGLSTEASVVNKMDSKWKHWEVAGNQDIQPHILGAAELLCWSVGCGGSRQGEASSRLPDLVLAAGSALSFSFPA